MKLDFWKNIIGAALGLMIAQSVWADALTKDVPGSADPAIIQRFAGSTMIGYQVDSWDSVQFPTSAVIDKSASGNPFKDLIDLEGVRTRAVYLGGVKPEVQHLMVWRWF